MTKKVISEIKERFKNIEGCGQRTHKANILVDSFLGEIFSNICEQAKDLEVCKNLLSIGIQVRKISPVSSDIWTDGIDFENNQIRNNYVLLNTIMDKVIAVVRFVYSIPDDSILEICLLESEKVSSGEPYLFFKITGDGIEIVLDSFPMMKTGAYFSLAKEISRLVKKDMESMVDELCGNIPNRTINNEASNVNSDTNTNSENNDEFEIVLKFKKPIGLGYHSSTETTESPDVFDVRADFISKYPELKENVSIARKVDKQGDISDIMEQKLRYDAVAATATYMLHKDNTFLSSLMNLEIDDKSKTDIGYAITRCRNLIVKESKK